MLVKLDRVVLYNSDKPIFSGVFHYEKELDSEGNRYVKKYGEFPIYTNEFDDLIADRDLIQRKYIDSG